MTYLFSSSQISLGRGYFGRSCASSLAMMSLQSATHSSQMNTRGPEISLRTSRRRFPQKEQWKSSIKEEYCTRFAPRQAPARVARTEGPPDADFGNLPLIFRR